MSDYLRAGNSSEACYALVAVDVPPSMGIDVFTYAIPPELLGKIVPGTMVIVPLMNKRRNGVVVSLVKQDGISARKASFEVKPILGIGHYGPVVNERQLRLCKWLRSRHACTLYRALSFAIAPGREFVFVERYHLVGDKSLLGQYLEAYGEVSSELERIISRKRGFACADLEKLVGEAKSRRIIRELLQKGLVEQREKLRLPSSHLSFGKVSGVARPDKDDASTESKEGFLALGANSLGEAEVLPPNLQVAFNEIASLIRRSNGEVGHEEVSGHGDRVLCVHGLSFLGKLQLLLASSQLAFFLGKRLVCLMPEIVEIKLAADYLRPRLGDRLVIYHSELRAPEKQAVHRLASEGTYGLLIGTRSAAFLPFSQVGGFFIVDDWDSSHKELSSPTYDAREALLRLGSLHRAPVVVLNSAPSLEDLSFSRLGQAKEVFVEELLDVLGSIEFYRDANCFSSGVSEQALASAKKKLEDGHLVVFNVKRRGFARAVMCRDCGFVPKCPSCERPLAFHRENLLVCHACNYAVEHSGACPSCGGVHLRKLGHGTQKVEEVLRRAFAGHAVLRLDSDSIDRTARQEIVDMPDSYRVVVGTDSIKKLGHSPRNIFMVFLNFDFYLGLPDYRAREKALLAVAKLISSFSRQARRIDLGFVVGDSQDMLIDYLSKADFLGFALEELEVRRQAGFPPYSDYVEFVFSSKSGDRARRCAENLVEFASRAAGAGAKVYGPMPCVAPKERGETRWKVVLLKRRSTSGSFLLSELVKKAYRVAQNNVKFRLEVNPYDVS